MNHEETPDPEAPHHGPVSPECPLECLRTLLSQHAYTVTAGSRSRGPA
jgi:hypothetical protein